jgi:hypothetical protein
MSSFLPLNNALAQNSVDFNSQTPTNSSGLFRYKVNTRNNNYTFTSTDFNSVCIFNSGGLGGLTLATLNSFSPAPPVGTEIILYSTTGSVQIAGTATLNSATGRFTTGINAPGKIIHRGNNVWYFASLSATFYSFNWTNCCSDSVDLYQIGTDSNSNFNPSAFSYTDGNFNIPFNGIVYYETELGSYYDKVVNGLVTGSSNCATSTFSTSYTYYTNTDPEDPQTVSIYSVSALTRDQPATLLGYSFFSTAVGGRQECYSSNRVSGVTYYINPGGGASITFYNGYVVSYTAS